MWCARIRKQLSAYADGELSLTDAQAVEEHVTQCERCAREQRSLQQLARLTALVPDEDFPVNLHARIMTGVRHAATAPVASVPTRQRRSITAGPWGFAVCTGAMAALLVGVLHTQGSNRGNTPVEAASVDVRAVEKPGNDAKPLGPKVNGTETVAQSKPLPAKPKEGRLEASVLPPAPVTRPVHVDSVPHNEAPRRTVAAAARKPEAQHPDNRAQASVTPGGAAAPEKPATEATAPATAPAGGNQAEMPSTPAVAMAVRTEPSPSEKEPMTRMVTNPMDTEPSKEDDEGLSSLKNFLKDRNKTVPQPPLLDPSKDRRPSRRSL